MIMIQKNEIEVISILSDNETEDEREKKRKMNGDLDKEILEPNQSSVIKSIKINLRQNDKVDKVDEKTKKPKSINSNKTEAIQAILQSFESSDIPERNVEQKTLNLTLLPYQKVGLAWMCNREKNRKVKGGILADDQGLGKTVSMISLIVTNTPSIANHSSYLLPSSSSSKIKDKVDDEFDGIEEIIDISSNINNTKHESFLSKELALEPGYKGGTLIICPLTVLNQWLSEINEKIHHSKGISVLVHRGKDKAKTPKELASYSVVLTTYQTTALEMPFKSKRKRKDAIYSFNINEEVECVDLTDDAYNLCDSFGLLYHVKWYRVVLDEAQTIRNSQTRVACAVSTLFAEHRWCLSGTPLQNSVKDLFSLFRFLRYSPYNTAQGFKTHITDPISMDQTKGFQKLRVILKGILLRRTKSTEVGGKKIIVLPPRHVRIAEVEMNVGERQVYETLKKSIIEKVRILNAKYNKKYITALLLLLRLRQATSHPWLIDKSIKFKKDIDKNLRSKLNYLKNQKENTRDYLFDILMNLENVCPSCSDMPEEPVITTCGHVLCYQCIMTHFERNEEFPKSCPVCGNLLDDNNYFTEACFKPVIGETHINGERIDYQKLWKTSARVEKLFEVLEKIFKGDSHNKNITKKSKVNKVEKKEKNIFSKIPDHKLIGYAKVTNKVLIFSQWTRMLDIIEIPLRLKKYKFRRLDGMMPMRQRIKVIEEFKEDPNICILIISYKAASLGLNLTSANHVILLDLWWNPSTEDQAIDRTHRIGQTRAVEVTRIIVKDTVDEAILKLQEHKRNIMTETLSRKSIISSNLNSLTFEELLRLFY